MFDPLSSQELIETLGITIKKDDINKLITFLCELSAYTEDSQFNISYNAPSSTGKSYIPTEIAALFPEEDVVEVGYCSPTAFFHDTGIWDEKNKKYVVDLSRKILIFLDQPHTLLLQHLRPLLSHDKKEIRIKITDKSQKFGLKTKNVVLRGFPAVIFCTAGLKIDEQEATRFLLLSPETNQEKIKEAIFEKVKREANKAGYRYELETHPERAALKRRIKAIRDQDIKEIRIHCPETLNKMFFEKFKVLKPRHARDIGRLISIIKSFSLLNLWHRKRDGLAVITNHGDLIAGFDIWDKISTSQELNIPPYILDLYSDVIMALCKEIYSEWGGGVSRKEILKKHFEVYHRVMPDWQLRQEIIPMLETAGLIYQEQDPEDKRKILIYPTTPLTISDSQINSELDGGVTLPYHPTHYISEDNLQPELEEF